MNLQSSSWHQKWPFHDHFQGKLLYQPEELSPATPEQWPAESSVESPKIAILRLLLSIAINSKSFVQVDLNINLCSLPPVRYETLCQYICLKWIHYNQTFSPQALVYINFTALTDALNKYFPHIAHICPTPQHYSLHIDPRLMHIQVKTITKMPLLFIMLLPYIY